MAQKPILRVEEYARALLASQIVKRARNESTLYYLQNQNSRTGFSVFPVFLEVVIADLKSESRISG
jgi:hypothetical protein